MPRSLLLPNAEADEGFRAEIRRGSILSLRAIGVIEMALPLVMLGAGLGVLPAPMLDWHSALPNLLFAACGATTLLAGFTRAGKRFPRIAAAVSIWATVAAMLASALLLPFSVEWLERHLLGYTILVMFGAAAAVPFKPVHTMTLGLSINALHAFALLVAGDRFASAGAEWSLREQAIGLVVTFLCVLLTVAVYRQRHLGYSLHRQALEAAERVRNAQCKLLVSENAATMGRVAAALSHELNSPVGVLASSVNTLSHLVERMAGADSEAARQRLRSVAADVTRSGAESAERLRGIVGRMQRFTNLDRAEVLPVNLNELLSDVLVLVQPDARAKVNVVRQLETLPQFVCRPQQMSAVFANLVSNAMRAAGEGGEVRVATHAVDGQIDIVIADNGAGIPEKQLAELFDPGVFHETDGRMAAGNWSMFSCRQIIREHGGEIDVTSTLGSGTSVLISLPVQNAIPCSVKP